MPHISKSSLLDRGECGYAWYCDHVLKLQGKDSLGMILGGVYHETIGMFFREKLKSKETEEKVCLDFFESMFNDRVKQSVGGGSLTFDEGEDKKFRDDGCRLVRAYLPYAKAIEPIAVEQKFELSIPGEPEWTVYGYIDLVGRRDGKTLVIDHKTGGSSPYKIDDRDLAGTDERRVNWVSQVLWSPEVACYVLAYRVVYGKEEDAFEYHWAIKTKDARILPTPVKIGDAQISWFLDLALDAIQGIKMGRFERNTSSNWCSPRGCAYWAYCHKIVVLPSDASRRRIEVV